MLTHHPAQVRGPVEATWRLALPLPVLNRKNPLREKIELSTTRVMAGDLEAAVAYHRRGHGTQGAQLLGSFRGSCSSARSDGAQLHRLGRGVQGGRTGG